jgi:hypothetical protein
MKLVVSALAVVVLAHGAGGGSSAARAPVLVELFTSEGCSSCPAADELLTRLQRDQPVANAEIIGLAFHVDYWDHQGWKDPYASKAFTARQRDYSRVFGGERIYTPQMIVDGREEFVGSDEALARKAAQAAAARPRLGVRLDARLQGQSIRLSMDLPAAPPDAEPIDVLVALTEDDLTSNVRRGENTGRTLSHSGVVRKLDSTGALDRDAFVANGQMPLERGWNSAKLRAVVWLQGRKTRHVYGVASAPVTP